MVKGRRGKLGIWDSQIHTTIYKINNKDLLYTIGNYSQCLLTTYNGQESKKNIYMKVKVLAAQVCSSLPPHGQESARLLCPWNFPGKNPGVGCRSLLQGVFSAQGLDPCLPHCRQVLYHLSHQGSHIYIYIFIYITESFCHTPESV